MRLYYHYIIFQEYQNELNSKLDLIAEKKKKLWCIYAAQEYEF